MSDSFEIRRKLIKFSMLTSAVAALSIATMMVGDEFFKADAKQTSAPIIGEVAPSFSGLTSMGDTISLAQFTGKNIVLEWTNHGCPFVKKHYEGGNMQASQKVVSADENTVWISVISSAKGKQGYVSGQEANTLTTSRGALPDYVILDKSGDIGRAYKAKTTPHMFVIDSNSLVQYNGAIDDKPSTSLASLEGATNYTLAALRAVKAGQAPDPSQTKPYGCSIKY